MTVDEIRRININYWADKIGRGTLAKKMGYSDTVYINQLCGGHGSFGSRTARKLEQALGLSKGEFDRLSSAVVEVATIAVSESSNSYKIRDNENNGRPVADVAPINRKLGQVPLISYIQAGNWIDAVDAYQVGDGAEWLNVPLEHSENAFCLKVLGASMDPEYMEGGVILVEPKTQAEHGDDVIVRTPDGGVTFKRLQRTPDGTHLLAINTDYPNRILEMPENSVICGVVTGYWVDKRKHK